MSDDENESEPPGSGAWTPWWPRAPRPDSGPESAEPASASTEADTAQPDRAGTAESSDEAAAEPPPPPPPSQSEQSEAAVAGAGIGAAQPHPSKRRTPLRILLLAALVALVVGSIAGYLGARVGAREPGAAAPATPSPADHPHSASSSAPTHTSPTPRPSATAHATATETPGHKTVGIARKVTPSTVTIRASSGNSKEIASGFAIDDDGRIITNNHVISDAVPNGQIQVKLGNGRKTKAKVLGHSRGYDLAVLQAKKHDGLHSAPLGTSSDTKVGEPVTAIGSPLGLGGTVTRGIVSAIDRPVAVGTGNAAEKKQAYLNAVQTDASINPGNSGGPLVNSSGKVVGVNSAILTGPGRQSDQSSGGNIGLGFAIPIDQAKEISKMLIKDGHATYPVLNAKVSDSRADGGVRLAHVGSNGAAHHAGLRRGDIITAIDGNKVSEAKALIVRVRKHRPGDKVTLKYRHDGKHHTAKVRLRSKRG